MKMTIVSGYDDHGHIPGDDVEEYEVNQDVGYSGADARS